MLVIFIRYPPAGRLPPLLLLSLGCAGQSRRQSGLGRVSEGTGGYVAVTSGRTQQKHLHIPR